MVLVSLDAAFSVHGLVVQKCGGDPLLVFAEGREKKALETFPAAFERLGFDPAKADAFAVNVGVGYSTGLRIAVTLAKTYAQLANKPLVTYTSAEALLANFPFEGRFLAVFKVSRYLVGVPCQTGGGLPLCGEPRIVSSNGGDFDAAVTLPPWLEEVGRIFGSKTLALNAQPLALGGAAIACKKLSRGLVADPLKVEPLYFRPPV